jgi:hypothetical protein
MLTRKSIARESRSSREIYKVVLARREKGNRSQHTAYINFPENWGSYVTKTLGQLNEKQMMLIDKFRQLAACRRDNVTADAAGRIGIFPLDHHPVALSKLVSCDFTCLPME